MRIKKLLLSVIILTITCFSVFSQDGEKLGEFRLTGFWSAVGDERSPNFHVDYDFPVGERGYIYRNGKDGFAYVIKHFTVYVNNPELGGDGTLYYPRVATRLSGNINGGYAYVMNTNPGEYAVWVVFKPSLSSDKTLCFHFTFKVI